MRQPEFWSAEAEGRDRAMMLRALLTPVSWAYAWAGEQRLRGARAVHAPAPVICVGNVTLGGAGKTPVARALRAALGPHAHTLSRGYGGRLPGPLRVTADMHADDVGDEPLLHAADGPAWIARNRIAGAMAAANAGARVIIMDDGFQNPSLGKDLSLLVIDAGFGLGNGAVFPAGPLREPWHNAIERADAVIVLGASGHNQADRSWLEGVGKPVLEARLEPTGSLPPGPWVAFAGLARPEKFFDTLIAMNADLAETVPYPDHHPYSIEDLDWLSELAAERQAHLLTTEKDAARLPPALRENIAVLPVTAQFTDPEKLDALLAPIRERMIVAHG
jgi:tetraacyldisaccharide 4'-kinase